MKQNFYLMLGFLLVIVAVSGCIESSNLPDEPPPPIPQGQQTTSMMGVPDEPPPPPPPSQQTTSIRVPQILPPESSQTSKPSQTSASTPEEFVGSWRVYSERIYYDVGGAGALLSIASGNAPTQGLILSSGGKWEFGDSKGTWTVTEITDEDWSRWDVSPYGPTRKLVLDGWKGDTADGPVEESTRVDFIWVIYHVEPPLVQNAGTIWMKFGH